MSGEVEKTITILQDNFGSLTTEITDTVLMYVRYSSAINLISITTFLFLFLILIFVSYRIIKKNIHSSYPEDYLPIFFGSLIFIFIFSFLVDYMLHEFLFIFKPEFKIIHEIITKF